MVLSIEEVLTQAEPNLTNHLVKAILEQTQCPICTDHMFVPVMTKCGHNFCYECITSWLVSNDGGATCPACREEIVEPPYFNIQIQELCNQLVSTMGKLREGGVPEFITTDRENKIKKYKRDLKTKKLYNNVFKNSAQAVIDKSDGVARCSNCHWEVEGNYCENCNTRLRNPNRIQEEFFDSDIDSDDRHHVVRYVNGNNDEDDDENSDTQPNSDDADFIDDRPIRNLDVYNENSDYSSGGSSPARQMPHDQSGLVEIVNRGGRRNVIPVTDSEEEQSDRDAPDYESWNGIHSSSSSQRNDPNSDSYNDSHSDGYRSEGSYNGQYQGEMHQGEDYGHYNQYNRNGYSSEEQEQRGYGHEQDYDDQYHSDEDHSSNGSYYSEENNENQGQYDNGEDYRDQDQYYSSSE